MHDRKKNLCYPETCGGSIGQHGRVSVIHRKGGQFYAGLHGTGRLYHLNLPPVRDAADVRACGRWRLAAVYPLQTPLAGGTKRGAGDCHTRTRADSERKLNESEQVNMK